DVFAGSVYVRCIAGDYVNVDFRTNEYDSGGTYIKATLGGPAATTLTDAYQRVVFNAATMGVNTATVHPMIHVSGLSTSTAYDFTLRLAAPQLELGRNVTSYIPTYGAAATRAADVAPYIQNPAWFNPVEGTFLVEAEVPY